MKTELQGKRRNRKTYQKKRNFNGERFAVVDAEVSRRCKLCNRGPPKRCLKELIMMP